MKKTLAALACLMLMCGLAGCSSPKLEGDKHWGSFTNATVVSSDGCYRAEHQAIRQAGRETAVIQVNVCDNAKDELLDSFIPARAMDFRGICWEEGTHRIWPQSADIEICCYELQDSHWALQEDIERPNSIVSKWDA